MTWSPAVSGLKFRVLREFLVLGYEVLLWDADVVILRNPFDHIYRDSTTDGHDNYISYGDVFNEELFFPSRPGTPKLLAELRQVIVHVNYHPDKLPGMKAGVEFYVNGNKDAPMAIKWDKEALAHIIKS
ncbi:hypothetical protein MLD38_034422 [Melastoma candidum]|uniref:Uncharacterized protein n=1 Tax=Melastoma candidum TaxID=119954 RepID=A0ACB9M9V5_9MYRT|nr:hypothetical protein MLD38_034422 [Melastoma candidum]